MTETQSEVPRWAVALFSCGLTLMWPLLLGHRGAPFEGFHRRELLMIAAGMVVWGVVGWILHGSMADTVFAEVR